MPHKKVTTVSGQRSSGSEWLCTQSNTLKHTNLSHPRWRRGCAWCQTRSPRASWRARSSSWPPPPNRSRPHYCTQTHTQELSTMLPCIELRGGFDYLASPRQTGLISAVKHSAVLEKVVFTTWLDIQSAVWGKKCCFFPQNQIHPLLSQSTSMWANLTKSRFQKINIRRCDPAVISYTNIPARETQIISPSLTTRTAKQ